MQLYQIPSSQLLGIMSHVFAASETGYEVAFEILGIHILVPANAAPLGKVIRISIITNIKKYITLGDNEMSVAFGIECLPNNLQLQEPLLAIIPHCASITRISNIQLIVYMGRGERGEYLFTSIFTVYVWLTR